MLCLLCNTTQAADINKVLSEEYKELFEKISKTSTFLAFYERNQSTTLLHSTQKVCETNRLQTV